MQFTLRPILFSIAAAFLLTGCLQDSETTRIPVRYTVLVRDGQTGKAIKGAEVSLTGEDETESTLKTNENGKVVFPSIESYVNQVIVTKKGYIPTDTVDAVTETDTTLKVILRTLNLTLLREGASTADTGKLYSYIVTVLDESTMSSISGATVSVRSGSAEEISATTDKNGKATLDSLPNRRNLFCVSKKGFVPADTLVVADSTDEAISLQALKIVLNPSVSE